MGQAGRRTVNKRGSIGLGLLTPDLLLLPAIGKVTIPSPERSAAQEARIGNGKTQNPNRRYTQIYADKICDPPLDGKSKLPRCGDLSPPLRNVDGAHYIRVNLRSSAVCTFLPGVVRVDWADQWNGK